MACSGLIILNKDQTCHKCGGLIPKGKVAVAHGKHNSRRHNDETTYYHPEHYTYADGEPILKIEEEEIRRYGAPPIRLEDDRFLL